jgi:hypothetical protein
MLACRECQKVISAEAERCPQCGCKYPTYQSFVSGRERQIAIWLAALIIGACLFFKGFYVGALVNNPNVGVALTAGGFGLGIIAAPILVGQAIALAWHRTFGDWKTAAARAYD